MPQIWFTSTQHVQGLNTTLSVILQSHDVTRKRKYPLAQNLHRRNSLNSSKLKRPAYNYLIMEHYKQHQASPSKGHISRIRKASCMEDEQQGGMNSICSIPANNHSFTHNPCIYRIGIQENQDRGTIIRRGSSISWIIPIRFALQPFIQPATTPTSTCSRQLRGLPSQEGKIQEGISPKS